jgi:hypothetical protein
MQISLHGLPYHYVHSGLQPLLCATKLSFMVKVMGTLLMVGIKLFSNVYFQCIAPQELWIVSTSSF